MSRRENVQQWKSLSAMLARGLPSMSAGYWQVAAACVLSCFSRKRCASHIISQSHTSALLSSRLTQQHHSLSTCEQTCYVQGLQDTNSSREWLFKPYYIWTNVKELATCLINISFLSFNFYMSCIMRPYTFVENYSYKDLYRKHKSIEHWQYQCKRRKLFCYLGITFLNRAVARFENQQYHRTGNPNLKWK